MFMTCSSPSRITLTDRSSFFSFSALNWRSFCQSFKDPTTTTITTATMIATPEKEKRHVSKVFFVSSRSVDSNLRPSLPVDPYKSAHSRKRKLASMSRNPGKAQAQATPQQQSTAEPINYNNINNVNDVVKYLLTSINKERILTKTLSFNASHISSSRLLLCREGTKLTPYTF